MSGSYNAYVGRIPETLTELGSYGELLLKMELTKQGGLVIGIRRASGESIFNPARTEALTPQTHLIYLSERPILDPP
jgi:hypothetical protein